WSSDVCSSDLLKYTNFIGIIIYYSVIAGGRNMDTLYIVLNVTVLAALIGLLILMQLKHNSFSKRVFTGLVLVIVLGAVLQAIYGTGSEVMTRTTAWYDIVGSGYIQLLMMIVVPLVMVSIIQSIINLEKSSDLGKMSGWIIGFLVSTAM